MPLTTPAPLRVVLRVFALCAGIALAGAPVRAQAEASCSLASDVPAQPLAQALAEVARQCNLQLIYVSELTAEQMGEAVRAGASATEALERLVAGAGLRFEFLNPRTVRVFASTRAAPAGGPPGGGGLHVTAVRPASAEPGTLGDVVVTAAQRDATADKVPISVSVWPQARLERAGVTDLPALAALTPGVEFDAFTDHGAAFETNIAIRGVNSKDGSTTGIFLDGIPLPTDRQSDFGRAYPGTFDLERVEILRGPQGMLAGEGAEGGVVSFIARPPSLTDYDATARGEFAATDRGAPVRRAGVAGGGPLVAESIGVRVAAMTERLGGFVDRVDPFSGATVEANANRVRNDLFRIAFELAPTHGLRITPAFHYQSYDINDSPAFYTYLSDPGRGVLRNGKLLQQHAQDRFYLPSLTIAVDLEFADLVATTAYLDRYANAELDGTNSHYAFWPNPMGPEYPVSYSNAKSAFNYLVQYVGSEVVRITSRPNGRLTWLAGADYVRGRYKDHDAIVTEALSDGGDSFGDSLSVRINERLGAFAEATLQASDRIALTGGLRVERDQYHSRQSFGLPTTPAALYFDVLGSAMQTAPRFTVSYGSDERRLIYASLSKGFRMGGPNPLQGAGCPVQTPASYGPDSLWSVELGTKDRSADGALRVEGSIFYSRWRALQVPIALPLCGYAYTTNVGAADDRGLDLGVEALLTRQLHLLVTAAYADTHYTQTALTSSGAAIVTRGDVVGSLPLVPAPWAVSAALDYDIPVGPAMTVNLHAQDVAHSHNPGPFASEHPNALIYAPTRTSDPATNQLDLRASAHWPRVELSAFVNNVLDAQPVLQRRNAVPVDTLFYATTFRPRTSGVAVTVSY